MKINFTTIINGAKTLISAHKVAAIVTASAIGVGAIATGVGIAVHNSNKTDKGQKDPPETTGKITETVDPTDDTTIGMTAEPEETTAEPETTVPETEEPETTVLETEEPETTAEPVTTEPETEAPAVTTAAPVTEPVVTEPVVTEPAYVGVTGITMDRYEVSMNVGETTTLVATIAPWNANNKAVYWISNSTIIGDIDQNGNLTATGAGSCVITITSADNVSVAATVNVTVTDPAATTTVNADAPTETTPTFVQAADLTTGISWDGVSPIVYTYPDGTTGTEIKVGATYEVAPGMITTVLEQDMPGFVFVPDFTCSDCGKQMGDGTNGTCVSYKLSAGAHNCPNCGDVIPEYACHTCD